MECFNSLAPEFLSNGNGIDAILLCIGENRNKKDNGRKKEAGVCPGQGTAFIPLMPAGNFLHLPSTVIINVNANGFLLCPVYSYMMGLIVLLWHFESQPYSIVRLLNLVFHLIPVGLFLIKHSAHCM